MHVYCTFRVYVHCTCTVLAIAHVHCRWHSTVSVHCTCMCNMYTTFTIWINKSQIPDRNGKETSDPRYLVEYPKYKDGWTPPYRNEDGSADFQLVFDPDEDTKTMRVLMPGFSNPGTYMLAVENRNPNEPIYCHGELLICNISSFVGLFPGSCTVF